MPTTIPYNPSLVLGNIVNDKALETLLQISSIQAGVDAAEDHYNALLTARRKLDMTNQELLDMGIDPSDDSKKQLIELNKQITGASDAYVSAQIDAENNIKPLREALPEVSKSVESPIDYNKTQLKSMPLSADSLKLDAQYFSYDSERQTAQSQASAIAEYVSDASSFLGDKYSSQMTDQAKSQAASQYENHDIVGTLVITAGCTHKDAVLLAPFILDVDKAIRVWNTSFPDDGDRIKVNSIANLQQIAAQEGTADEKFLQLISGATYGSSFVGMVHVLNTTETSSSQSMTSVAASMQEQFTVGCMFENESGGFGINASFADDIKNLISTQNVTSHITVIAMGVIPSIKSNDVKIGIQQFATFDPKSMMDNLTALANATAGDQATVDSSAANARTGGQMLAMQASQVKNVMLSLSEIDEKGNKMLDVVSLMTAFEDYVNKAIAGKVGVPINYYLKGISRAELAQMWVAKYYPNQYLSISGDDSNNGGGTNGGSSSSTTPASSGSGTSTSGTDGGSTGGG